MKLQFLGAAGQVTGSRYLLARRRSPRAGRLRHVSGAGVPGPQLGAQRLSAQADRRPAADPRPRGPLRAGAQAGPRGLSRPDLRHRRHGRPGGRGAPRRGQDSDGRRRVQAEASSQGGSHGPLPGQAPVHRRRRQPHPAAVAARALPRVGPDPAQRHREVSATPAISSARPCSKSTPRRTANRGGWSSRATWANGTSRSSATHRSSPRPTTSSWSRPTATADTTTTRTSPSSWPG